MADARGPDDPGGRIRRAAEEVAACALHDLGVVLLNEDGPPAGEAEAVGRIRREAEDGVVEAIRGRLGDGVPPDVLLAGAGSSELLRLTAEEGVILAMHDLGAALFRGDGLPEDRAGAVRWWRRAAGAGCVESMCRLSEVLARGDGVPADEAEAAGWRRRAAEEGYDEAAAGLAGPGDSGG